ncbi:MAG: exo-alpha-sialidase [Phycisphaeraceae bacterium]
MTALIGATVAVAAGGPTATRAEGEGGEPIVLQQERIDVPTDFAHASTITQARDGALVVAWYGGQEEGDADNRVYVTRNDGSGWSEPIALDDDGKCQNPVIYQPRKAGAPMLLYYKFFPRRRMRTSEDGGRTWSDPRELPDSDNPVLIGGYGGGFVGPSKNKPLELPNGTLLLGSSTETDENGRWSVDHFQVHVERTTDYWNDFELVGPLDAQGENLIQPTFLMHSPDGQRVQMICRKGLGSSGPTFFSDDAGKSWGPMRQITGSYGRAGIDALTLDNGLFVLAGSVGANRSAGRISVSADGVHWTAALDGVNEGVGFEYPAMIQTTDRKVHLTYTRRTEEGSYVGHMVLDPDALTAACPEFTHKDMSFLLPTGQPSE